MKPTASKNSNKRQSHRTKSGFSLIEMLLCVAVLGCIFAFSNPIYALFQTRNDLDIASDTVANELRSAQTFAQAVDGDIEWGVYVQNTGVTLFKGSTYATRDTTYDQVATFTSSMTVSGPTEIIFSKVFGLPSTTGTITLTSPNNETRTVAINAKGTLTY